MVVLEKDFKPKTDEVIDQLVSAELPDQHNDPILFELVKSHMVHGPCGDLNPRSPCMDDRLEGRICTKNYPKEFCQQSLVNEDGYPKYRRREPKPTEKPVEVGKFTIDNRWIVPHNSYLLKKYAMHT